VEVLGVDCGLAEDATRQAVRKGCEVWVVDGDDHGDPVWALDSTKIRALKLQYLIIGKASAVLAGCDVLKAALSIADRTCGKRLEPTLREFLSEAAVGSPDLPHLVGLRFPTNLHFRAAFIASHLIAIWQSMLNARP